MPGDTKSVNTTRRPKLLFVSQQLPFPLNDGGNIRTYHILRSLAAAFDVTLVASSDNPKAGVELDKLISPGIKSLIVPDSKSDRIRHWANTLFRTFQTGMPVPICYNYNTHLAEALHRITREQDFDLYHLNHTDTAQYFDCLAPERCTIDTHNLLFDYYQKAAARGNPLMAQVLKRWARSLENFERRTFHKVGAILVCSHRERDILSRGECDQKMMVAPNGVDFEYFNPPVSAAAKRSPTILFIGNMSYRPNLEGVLFFIRSIFPLLRKRISGIRFLAVGKGSTEEIFRARAGAPDIEITGEVADVRPYIARSHVFVVPLNYGGGTRLKVLEAFASAIPVVSTTVGAEGIECRNGKDILLADTPEDFSETVVQLFENQELRNTLISNAHQLALEKYNWEFIGQSVVRWYQEDLLKSDEVCPPFRKISRPLNVGAVA
jgi:polysaccharide biosynthesis protein PslH